MIFGLGRVFYEINGYPSLAVLYFVQGLLCEVSEVSLAYPLRVNANIYFFIPASNFFIPTSNFFIPSEAGESLT